MRDLHEAAGAVFGMLRGVEVPRRYGDPAGEFQAATAGTAVRDRSHRVRLRFSGRQPAAMLRGIVTGRVPGPLADVEPEVWQGRAEPNAVLTPKGRVVTDLRLWRAEGEGEMLEADVPAAGAGPLMEHLGRYLPPRFATVEDRSADTGMLTLVGPEAPALLSREVTGLRVDPPVLEAMAEGDLRRVGEGLFVIRTSEIAAPAWDVVADRATIRALWSRLLEVGASPLGSGVWEALRLEAGRPAYGADMDIDTLLPETGLVGRVVDQTKGCYTGQEVVVRIRDRGHVNRHLRRLRLGDAPTPTPGVEVWAEEAASGRDGDGGSEGSARAARPVGVVTSVALSPRLGTLALAYVRREVEPGASVRVGSADGVTAVVEAVEAAEERPG